MDRIILLHRAVVNSHVAELKSLKHIYFKTFRIILDFGPTKLLKAMRDKYQIISTHIIFGNLIISNIENLGQDACRTILEIRLIRF